VFFSVSKKECNYWYDTAGERTVKESSDGEGVSVNGLLSGARTGTTKFTAYISPYLVVSNGGNYTKHIYMGSQRIISKVSDSGIFGTSPVNTTDLKPKYTAQTAALKLRYDSLGVQYKGVEKSGSIVSSSPSGVSALYFYHPDHLGSSSLITDVSGDIVQHVEYVPFGGTFIDERRTTSSWHTPFLFSGKERDEETGLLYVSQRYQDEKYGIWYSVDQLAEKYPNVSSYVYCMNNPVKYIDPDGRDAKVTVKDNNIVVKANIILFSKSGKIDEKVINSYKEQVEKNWTKDENGKNRTYSQDGKKYNVVFDINVSSGSSDLSNENNRDYNGVNNYIEVIQGNDYSFRSKVLDTNSGIWTTDTKQAYHEFAHILGIQDRYKNSPDGKSSKPDAGYRGNVMGSYGGKVTQTNINSF